jgi:hypothetical protein
MAVWERGGHHGAGSVRARVDGEATGELSDDPQSSALVVRRLGKRGVGGVVGQAGTVVADLAVEDGLDVP